MSETFAPIQFTKAQLKALVALGYDQTEIDGIAIMEIVALAIKTLKHPIQTYKKKVSLKK